MFELDLGLSKKGIGNPKRHRRYRGPSPECWSSDALSPGLLAVSLNTGTKPQLCPGNEKNGFSLVITTGPSQLGLVYLVLVLTVSP